ncbi:MAG: hypothetical protein M1822_008698 [Bathelium mastoideum]|nr:MAG: hypothetical protein M1822_008698 [Bathelium mastoideum]
MPRLNDHRYPLTGTTLFSDQTNKISRVPSNQNAPKSRNPSEASATGAGENMLQTGRRRSSSEPQRMAWPPRNEDTLARPATRSSYMDPVEEESSRAAATRQPASTLEPAPQPPAGLSAPAAEAAGPGPGMLRRASVAFGSAIRLNNKRTSATADPSGAPLIDPNKEYESQLVDILDVVDPEVATLSTLTNVQNSLFIPDLGPLFNRRPTYTLSRRPSDSTVAPLDPLARHSTIHEDDATSTGEKDESRPSETDEDRPSMTRSNTLSTITSTVSESRYAVKPKGFSFDGWSAQDKAEINDHVRHQLHSRRSKFKRSWRGFLKYISRPLGLFVFVYATLITLFGLAWVLFLIGKSQIYMLAKGAFVSLDRQNTDFTPGWINVGGRRDYIINVIDNVLVALFAVIGDGLAPFRAVDTYHMIFIAHYHHLTWRLRKEKALPKLQDENDLPSKRPANFDIEASADAAAIAARSEEKEELTVLTPKQQRKLQHHQDKFSKSHTFYKPHETETHHAFPLRLLVAVVVLLDCHSLFQIALGTCTWAISYHVRPFALTTVILCCSISCNIAAGITITVGDRLTRKKDVIERIFRQELTEHAIRKLEKRKAKERNRNRELEASHAGGGGGVDTVPEESEPNTPGLTPSRAGNPMEDAAKGGRPPVPKLRVVSAENSLPATPGESSSSIQNTPMMERSRPVERTVYEGT